VLRDRFIRPQLHFDVVLHRSMFVAAVVVFCAGGWKAETGDDPFEFVEAVRTTVVRLRILGEPEFRSGAHRRETVGVGEADRGCGRSESGRRISCMS
jgi:glycine/D-amino acid oxidase-like deaminating enzyme